MIGPEKKLGILGGGQLGTFFTIAAKRLGYRVAVWDPSPDAPAGLWADTFISLPFDDSRGLQSFLKASDAVTYEWENIPVSLVEAIEATVPVRPGSRILRLLQNRISEKGFLAERHFPVTPFRALKDPQNLQKAVDELGLPSVCKTATAGYDGHGQWRLHSKETLDSLSQSLSPRPAGWIVEKWAPFVKELSVVVVRNEKGDLKRYPVTENLHEKGILRLCQAPAEIDPALARRADAVAADAITALGGKGVFCVEMFLLPDETLLINEIAPRPHNSGHYSMDACTVSQFEQQVRALCDLPLIAPRLLTPAVMVNILGAEIDAVQSPGALTDLLSIPGARIYNYRKETIKEGRKMGHVTVVDPEPHKALEKARRIRSLLDRFAKCAQSRIDPPEG